MAAEGETTPVDVGVSDAELFDQAATNTPDTPVEEAAEQPVDETQPRDDQGRFAAKDEPEKSEPEVKAEQPATDDDKHGQIPSWRLREEREARAEAQKQLEAERSERARERAELEIIRREIATLKQPKTEQPKEQKPDPLIDPEGYEKYIERKFEDRLLSERRELSLAQAHRTHKEAFVEAYAEAQKALAQGDPALAARMQQSRDPGETLMEWHRQRKIMAEVGNDPNVFFEKRLESYLADPANLAKVIEKARGVATQSANSQQRPNVKLPPTLSSMSPASGVRGDDDDGDLSDEALFKQAIR